MQYATRPLKPTSKRRRDWKLWTGVSIVLVIGLVVFSIWAFSGNQAKITPSDSVPRTNQAAYQSYKSNYLSLTYKGIYQQKSRVVQDGVEQTLLRADTTYEKTLAIEVQPLPPSGVSADSGYNYRQSHPDLYQAQQIIVAGAPATKWIKNDGTEQTIYLSHDDHYAVLSFSLARTNDTSGLPDEVAAVLRSFHWK